MYQELVFQMQWDMRNFRSSWISHDIMTRARFKSVVISKTSGGRVIVCLREQTSMDWLSAKISCFVSSTYVFMVSNFADHRYWWKPDESRYMKSCRPVLYRPAQNQGLPCGRWICNESLYRRLWTPYQGKPLVNSSADWSSSGAPHDSARAYP